MKKNLFIYGLIGAMALTACSKSKEEKGLEPLSCDNPQLSSEIQKTLQTVIDNNANQFVQSDARHFVDADKVMSAAKELTVSLSAAELGKDANNKQVCNSNLSITVPENIWKDIQTYAPLVNGKTDYAAHIKEQLQSNGFTMQNNVFTKPFQYTPLGSSIKAGSAASATATLGSDYDKSAIQNVAITLGNALLAYGVKDTVNVGGHLYHRADALTLIHNPGAQVKPVDQISVEAQKASAILNGQSVVTTTVNNNRTNSVENNVNGNQISARQLQEARDNNANANNNINHLWVNLDDSVRNTLRPEERKWIENKVNQCKAQAANAKSSVQSEYTYLQCETKLTNERINYLKGYSLH